jgi:hypothetical protein
MTAGLCSRRLADRFFLAIYVAAPDASPEARDNLVAETARISIAALTRPVGAAK